LSPQRLHEQRERRGGGDERDDNDERQEIRLDVVQPLVALDLPSWVRRRPPDEECSRLPNGRRRPIMDSPVEPIRRALCGTTFTHSFQLQSPGVLFVKLTPALP